MVKILGKIKNYIPSASMALARGVGLAGLGVVAYDAHYVGKMKSDFFASERDAKTAQYYLNNSNYLDSLSKSKEKVKNWAYNTNLDNTWRRFINEGVGYVYGFTSMLISHVIPLGLGLTALLTKGKTSKISAGALAVYGAVKFVKNFFGLGIPPGVK